ncbi:hypothetical protein EUX98_g1285 [Antrodiella citrinella]|uniref:cellulase n=1 Tax=Antrodiella citrinella TaxID=2447956 RepID=A0A4S4NAE1_9APHY|nr:hypothetical protein EUX98_g1285 [Antrodiella citrinella]
MYSLLYALVSILVLAGAVNAQTTGITTMTWDCCEPACGYTSNLSPGAVGPVKSCNQQNGPAAAGTQNACITQGGQTFSCSTYQPIIVNNTFSYGFAGHGDTATATCCMCYEFTWTSGAGEGKSMIVQAINAGGITATDLDIYTPDYNACTAQYGAPSGGWGRQYGGANDPSRSFQRLY